MYILIFPTEGITKKKYFSIWNWILSFEIFITGSNWIRTSTGRSKATTNQSDQIWSRWKFTTWVILYYSYSISFEQNFIWPYPWSNGFLLGNTFWIEVNHFWVLLNMYGLKLELGRRPWHEPKSPRWQFWWQYINQLGEQSPSEYKYPTCVTCFGNNRF